MALGDRSHSSGTDSNANSSTSPSWFVGALPLGHQALNQSMRSTDEARAAALAAGAAEHHMTAVRYLGRAPTCRPGLFPGLARQGLGQRVLR